MDKNYYVYLITNWNNKVLYIGVTSNLVQRVWQHKNNLVEGFTKKYHAHRLVYYELHETMDSAIMREKQMKKWKRDWKINLIEKDNLRWEDLWPKIL